MTAVFVHMTVALISAVLGLIAGRAIAIEGETWIAAVLGAAYVGAGVGLMCAILIGSPLTLVAQLLNTGSSTWFDALDVAGSALLWGTAAGAASGLLVGTVIAACSLRRVR